MSLKKFYYLLNGQAKFLLYSFVSSKLREMVDCFKSSTLYLLLLRSSGSEQREIIGFEMFERAWKPFELCSSALMRLCAGIALIFSGTCTVEFDFLTLGKEKNGQSDDLRKLAAAGAMPVKE